MRKGCQKQKKRRNTFFHVVFLDICFYLASSISIRSIFYASWRDHHATWNSKCDNDGGLRSDCLAAFTIFKVLAYFRLAVTISWNKILVSAMAKSIPQLQRHRDGGRHEELVQATKRDLGSFKRGTSILECLLLFVFSCSTIFYAFGVVLF